MKLSEKIKKAIEAEFNQWVESQYAGKDKKDRQQRGQFFTPPPLTIKMLEKFDSIKNKKILDPTLGAGGLIAAAIIAGANPKMCYGIELDPEILAIAKKRLCPLGVPEKNLKLGNALDPEAYEFEEPEEADKISMKLEKQDKSLILDADVIKSNETIKHINIELITKNQLNLKNLTKIHKAFSKLQLSNFQIESQPKHLKALNTLFAKSDLPKLAT